MNTNTVIINKVVNSVYGLDMVLLKTYIYKKEYENGFTQYLTLFSLLPAKEYRQDITVWKDKDENPISTGTHGVYVKTVGSQTGLVETINRVSLNNYQKHLEANGWQFVKTVPGTFGLDLEVARQTAFREICKLKGEGDKEELIDDLKLEMYNLSLAFSNGQRDSLGEYIADLEKIVQKF